MTDPIIKRGSLRTVTGVEVDTLALTLLCNSDVTVQGQALPQFASAGGFDGARVELRRHFAANWQSASAGSLHLFAGRVSELPSISGTEVQVSVRSDLELLNVMMPRNLYQAPCAHTLYNAGCSLVAASWTVTGADTGGSTRRSINTNFAQAAGYFDLGTIAFTTGPNAGITRTVRSHASGVIVPSFPFPYTPGIGDAISAKPGCDRLRTTCAAKFSNANNFRGFDLIPAPELSY